MTSTSSSGFPLPAAWDPISAIASMPLLLAPFAKRSEEPVELLDAVPYGDFTSQRTQEGIG